MNNGHNGVGVDEVMDSSSGNQQTRSGGGGGVLYPMSFSQPLVTLYPLSNYTFGTKEPLFERDTNISQR